MIASLAPGARVVHTKRESWGVGVVVGWSEGKMTVEFGDVERSFGDRYVHLLRGAEPDDPEPRPKRVTPKRPKPRPAKRELVRPRWSGDEDQVLRDPRQCHFQPSRLYTRRTSMVLDT